MNLNKGMPCFMMNFVMIGLAVFLCASEVSAKKNVTKELSEAQALLAKGDYDAAFKEYQYFAEEKENSLAQFTMGLFFRLGWGRQIDDKKACEWFERAGNNGIPTATHFFADCLKDGAGMEPDPARAAQWYQKAADLGYHISLCSLAQLYMTGNGVPKDPEKALELCKKAADKRVIPAQIQMGHFYMEKDTGVQDYASAFDWFSKAAEMNIPEAQYYLGLMLRDGLGRTRDHKTALMWFELAAAKGYEKAYFPVGSLYYNSPKDPETGLIKAADLAKSYMWLTAAIRQKADPSGQKAAEDLKVNLMEIMPETWKKDLDSKVEDHFKSYPSGKL